MEISTVILAQGQFSLNLGLFSLFAASATSLAWVVFWFRLCSWKNAAPGWIAAYRFWVRIFALCYFLALGYLVPLLIQLGTLWPGLLERVGNVAGPLVAFGLVSLFLFKSIFMGTLLYGQRRVSPRTHVISALGVAIGMSITSWWAVSFWSWLQTPDGATLIDGRFQVYHWPDVILNPLAIPHMLLFLVNGLLAVGFMMIGVTGWLSRKRPLNEGEQCAFRVGLVIALVAALSYWVVLDASMQAFAKAQPLRAAAMAAYWQSGGPADLVLLGWPDLATQSVNKIWSISGAQTRWLGINVDQALLGLDAGREHLPAIRGLFLLTRILLFVLLALTLLVLTTWWLSRRRGGDAAQLPSWLASVLAKSMFMGGMVCLLCFFWLEAGRWPYMVHGAILASDVVVQASATTLGIGMAGWLLLGVVLVVGFVRMFFHAARYGVVAVRKADARGKA